MKRIILILIALISLSSFVSAVTIDDVDLIGYWKLDESGVIMVNSKDNLLHSYDLQYNGALQQQTAVPSYSSFSLGFDETNDFARNVSMLLHVTASKMGEFTGSCWIGAQVYGADYKTIMATRTNDGKGWQFYLRLEGGGGMAYHDGTSDNEFTGMYPYTFSMMSLKRNSSGVSYYVNDTQVFYDSSVGTPTPSTTAFSIGAAFLDVGSNHEQSQVLDECWLINRSLTDSEISDIYSNGIGSGVTDTCTPPATGNYDVTASDNCDWTTNDEIPGNISITSSGNLTLRANWTFTGVEQYIFIDGIVEFAVFPGGSING